MFGLAAKASAQAAAAAGEGTEADCVAHARKRFEEAFAQQIHVVVAETLVTSFDTAADENDLLATAHRRQIHKHH